MPPAPDDISILEWAIGGITTLMAGSIAHIYTRINAIDSQRAEDAKAARQEIDSADTRIWSAIDSIRERVMNQPSKDDLRDMERRVTDLIKAGQR